MAHSDDSSPSYTSSFWPVLILALGLLLFIGYQIFAVCSERNLIHQRGDEINNALSESKVIHERLYLLAKDLVDTSSKDANAAQIVKDANLHVVPTTNAPAAEAPASAPANP